MDGRTAIVTGGAGGIGAAIVARLRRADIPVASVDLLAPGDARDGVLDLVCDLADDGQITDAVVHCAAFQLMRPFAELTVAEWEHTFHVNVDGAFHLLRETVPDLRAHGGGRIVLITSSSYFQPPPGLAHYVASKGALTGLVRGLSAELGAEGITVNAVAPGLTRSANAVRTVPEEHFDLVRSRQAIPRSGEPDDIAAAVAFLVSADAGFITGQTLLVDGGESRL